MPVLQFVLAVTAMLGVAVLALRASAAWSHANARVDAVLAALDEDRDLPGESRAHRESAVYSTLG